MKSTKLKLILNLTPKFGPKGVLCKGLTGAYTGLSAVFFATKYPKAKVVAIEPVEFLDLNVKLYTNAPTKHRIWWFCQ